MTPTPRRSQQAFSLIELTVVLVIVALLSSGLMLGLSAQHDASSRQEAQRQLDSAKEALLGFAISNGRLPCPATPTLANTDTNAGKENCAAEHGVLPWTTLGLPETDPWGQRLTYYARNQFTAALTAGALASFTLDTTGNANIKDAPASGYNIASYLPAVLLSHGSNGYLGYLSNGLRVSMPPEEAARRTEEAENANGDLTFVSHTPSDTFDDLVAWIIPTVLKSRMVAVGKLP